MWHYTFGVLYADKLASRRENSKFRQISTRFSHITRERMGRFLIFKMRWKGIFELYNFTPLSKYRLEVK